MHTKTSTHPHPYMHTYTHPHPHPPSLITCSTHDIEQSVAVVRPNECGREDDRVEGHIVLSHELTEGDLLWVLPPLTPLGGVARCDGDVAEECGGDGRGRGGAGR